MSSWRAAGSLVVHKMLGELSYEGLFEPVPDGDGWLLEFPTAAYRFRARRGAFESWHVEPGSATRDGEPAHDPRVLVIDARQRLGLTGLRLADVLAELTATVTNEPTRLAAAPTATATRRSPAPSSRCAGSPCTANTPRSAVSTS